MGVGGGGAWAGLHVRILPRQFHKMWQEFQRVGAKAVEMVSNRYMLYMGSADYIEILPWRRWQHRLLLPRLLLLLQVVLRCIIRN